MIPSTPFIWKQGLLFMYCIAFFDKSSDWLCGFVCASHSGSWSKPSQSNHVSEKWPDSEERWCLTVQPLLRQVSPFPFLFSPCAQKTHLTCRKCWLLREGCFLAQVTYIGRDRLVMLWRLCYGGPTGQVTCHDEWAQAPGVSIHVFY